MRRRNLLINSGGNSVNGHEYVEIGGVKWAKTNIGAESETDYGLYFQWGDTAGYTSGQCGSNSTAYAKPFNELDCVLHNGTTVTVATAFTKYNGNDDKTVLEPCNDAAVLHWGADWRMPTAEEFAALSAATVTAWTSNYNSSGVPGLVLTDNTDNSKKLFFPAAGSCTNGKINNGKSNGYYWSSSCRSGSWQNAYSLRFLSTKVYGWNNSAGRTLGYNIRPVLDL